MATAPVPAPVSYGISCFGSGAAPPVAAPVAVPYAPLSSASYSPPEYMQQAFLQFLASSAPNNAARIREEEEEALIQKRNQQKKRQQEEKEAQAAQQREELEANRLRRKELQEKEEAARIERAHNAKKGIDEAHAAVKRESAQTRALVSETIKKRNRAEQLRKLTNRSEAQNDQLAQYEREIAENKQRIRQSGERIQKHADALQTHVDSLHQAHRDAVDQKIERNASVVDKNKRLERDQADASYRKASKHVNDVRAAGAAMSTEIDDVSRADRRASEAARSADRVKMTTAASAKNAARAVPAPADGLRYVGESDRTYDQRITQNRLKGTSFAGISGLGGRKGAETLEKESNQLHAQAKQHHEELVDATNAYKAADKAASEARALEQNQSRALAAASTPEEKAALQKELDETRARRESAEKDVDRARARAKNATQRLDETTSKLEANEHEQYQNARDAYMQQKRNGVAVDDLPMKEQALNASHRNAAAQRAMIREATQTTRVGLAEREALEAEERENHNAALDVRARRASNARETEEIDQRLAKAAADRDQLEIDLEAIDLKRNAKNTPPSQKQLAQLARDEANKKKQLATLDRSVAKDTARREELARDTEQLKGNDDEYEEKAAKLRETREKTQSGAIDDARAGNAARRQLVDDLRKEAEEERARANQLMGASRDETDPVKREQMVNEANTALTSARQKENAAELMRAGVDEESEQTAAAPSFANDREIEKAQQAIAESLDKHSLEESVVHEIAQTPGETDAEYATRMQSYRDAQEAAIRAQRQEEDEAKEKSAAEEKREEEKESPAAPKSDNSTTNIIGGSGGGGSGILPSVGGGGGGSDAGALGAGGLGGFGGGLVGPAASSDGGEASDEETEEAEETAAEQGSEEEFDYASDTGAEPVAEPVPESEAASPESNEEAAEVQNAIVAQQTAPAVTQPQQPLPQGQQPPLYPVPGFTELAPLAQDAETVIERIPIIGRALNVLEEQRTEKERIALEHAIPDRRLAHVERPRYVYDDEATKKYSDQLPSHVDFEGHMLVAWQNGETNGEHVIELCSTPDKIARTVVKEVRDKSYELFVLVKLQPAPNALPIAINTDHLSFCIEVREHAMTQPFRALDRLETAVGSVLGRLLSKHKREATNEPVQFLVITSRSLSEKTRPAAAAPAAAAGRFGLTRRTCEPRDRRVRLFVGDVGECVYDAKTNQTQWNGPYVRVRDDDGVLRLNLLTSETTHPEYYICEYDDRTHSGCMFRFRFEKATSRFADIEYLIPLHRYSSF